jgi:hypothetical protein
MLALLTRSLPFQDVKNQALCNLEQTWGGKTQRLETPLRQPDSDVKNRIIQTDTRGQYGGDNLLSENPSPASRLLRAAGTITLTATINRGGSWRWQRKQSG